MWLALIGLPVEPPLELAIRFKFLILLATGIKRRSSRWLRAMPLEVRAAAMPGHLVPVFWPPPGSRLGSSEIDKLFATLQGSIRSVISPTQEQLWRLAVKVDAILRKLLRNFDRQLGINSLTLYARLVGLFARGSVKGGRGEGAVGGSGRGPGGVVK